MAPNPVRCLLLHTGGACGLDVTGTMGPRQGPLVRWLGQGWGLELGEGLLPALEQLGADRTADKLPVSAWWVHLSGERPTGSSGDLVLAAAILLRARARGRTGSEPSTPWVVTGSGHFTLSADGQPRVEEVQGWPMKLAALVDHSARQPAAELLLLCPASQAAEVLATLQSAQRPEAPLPVKIAPVSGIGSLLRALQPLLGERPREIPGWPEPGDDACLILEHAFTYAEQQEMGYLGVEHLTHALLDSVDPGPALKVLRTYLTGKSLLPTPNHKVKRRDSSVLLPSPRVSRLGATLSAGFGAEALARALCEDLSSPLHELAGLNLAQTLARAQHGGTLLDDPYRTQDSSLGIEISAFEGLFEVQGGPEDGRRIPLVPEQTLGRSAPENGPSQGLYQSTAIVDQGLSRRSLEYLGQGMVRALTPLVLRRAAETLPVKVDEIITVHQKDLLSVSSFTRILALGRLGGAS